jgi:hypothetical protein
MSPVQGEAMRLLAAGISVRPIRSDSRKAPVTRWKPYQARRATPQAWRRWCRQGPVGLALVCGTISRGVTASNDSCRATEGIEAQPREDL